MTIDGCAIRVQALKDHQACHISNQNSKATWQRESHETAINLGLHPHTAGLADAAIQDTSYIKLRHHAPLLSSDAGKLP